MMPFFIITMGVSQSVCKIEKSDSVKITKSQIYFLTKTFIIEQWKETNSKILVDDEKNGVIIIESNLIETTLRGPQYTFVYTTKFIINEGKYNLLINCENCEYSGLLNSGIYNSEWETLISRLDKDLNDIADKYKKSIISLNTNQTELYQFVVNTSLTNTIDDNLSLKSIDNKINNIQLNLDKCHEQFKKGTTCIGLGIGLSAIGTFCLLKYVKSSNIDDYNKGLYDIGRFSAFIGGTLTTIGFIVQIDSHKWIGRTGNKR